MINKIIGFCAVFSFVSASFAAEIDTNTAKLQAMDKITGRVSVIEVPVNSETKFGSLSVVIRSCKTRPVEETPDNFAFIDITDTNLKGEEYNVFKGWMISSSPATHALEHPIYDVWLLQCIDTKVDKKQLWSEEQLAERDALPMLNRPSVLTDNTPQIGVADAQKPEKLSDVISEMSSEEMPETKTEDMIMTNEFSFDEDEEIEIIEEDDLEEDSAEEPAASTSETNSDDAADRNTEPQSVSE